MLWGQSLEHWEIWGLRLRNLALVLGMLVPLVAFGSSYILWKVGKLAQAPRELDSEQSEAIAKSVEGFAALRVVLGAVPPSTNNTALADQILTVLLSAHVDAFVNHAGVAAEVDPSQIRGRLATQGIPTGVTIFYVTGNRRGEAFSNALSKALNGAGLVAIPRGNWREEWVVNTMKQSGVDRNDKRFEPVTIVVGDKP